MVSQASDNELENSRQDVKEKLSHGPGEAQVQCRDTAMVWRIRPRGPGPGLQGQ